MPNPDAKSRNGRHIAIWLPLIGVFLIAGMAVFALLRREGAFPRARLEAIVERVRILGVAPGETREFRLDDLSDPTAVRTRRPNDERMRGQCAGDIWAQRTTTGKLRVVIETQDNGHAGEFGFAYSEDPLKPQPFGEGKWFTLDVPGRLYLVLPNMRIDDSWWRVLYNLD